MTKRASSYAVDAARQARPHLVDFASRGIATIITRHARPIAALVPLVHAQGQALSTTTALRGSGPDLWTGPDAVGPQRDEWD